MSGLIVQLRDIPCRHEAEVSAQFVAETLASLAMRQALERPADDPDAGGAKLEVELYLEGKNVFARGTLRGHMVVACGRCLGPVALPLDEALQVTYLPKAAMPSDTPPDEDEDGEAPAEFDEDDLDLYPYEGEVIDLAPLLREELLLAVPYAPLCREDCKGLCPQCGVDRNTVTCACDPTPIDPRLATLKDLKV